MKDIVIKKYHGEIDQEFTIIKGFTVEIPSTIVKSIASLDEDLNINIHYPVNIEKDSTVSIAG